MAKTMIVMTTHETDMVVRMHKKMVSLDTDDFGSLSLMSVRNRASASSTVTAAEGKNKSIINTKAYSKATAAGILNFVDILLVIVSCCVLLSVLLLLFSST